MAAIISHKSASLCRLVCVGLTLDDVAYSDTDHCCTPPYPPAPPSPPPAPPPPPPPPPPQVDFFAAVTERAAAVDHPDFIHNYAVAAAEAAGAASSQDGVKPPAGLVAAMGGSSDNNPGVVNQTVHDAINVGDLLLMRVYYQNGISLTVPGYTLITGRADSGSFGTYNIFARIADGTAADYSTVMAPAPSDGRYIFSLAVIHGQTTPIGSLVGQVTFTTFLPLTGSVPRVWLSDLGVAFNNAVAIDQGSGWNIIGVHEHIQWAPPNSLDMISGYVTSSASAMGAPAFGYSGSAGGAFQSIIAINYNP